jgi:dolichyl-phosphate-mannose--protein O-mannosyl transferase
MIQYNMSRYSILLLAIPLALSTFTHLYNPIGFPSVYVDEDTYMQRAMVLLKVGNALSTHYLYDHPYFGWLFLSGLLGITGYPNSLHPSPANVHSIEMLYFVPRVLMGILAVVDTFVIYKMSERRYNRKVAFIASVLFAVMPFTWLTRRILLDSIQLPFLLSSILFAVYAKKSIESKNKNNDITTNTASVLLSGIFLGLAIFTKIPALTMIPLVGFLVYTNSSNKSLKMLGYWLIPVILIPLTWPAHAFYIGQFNLWLDGVVYQAHREDIKGLGLSDLINSFFQIDPILLILGIAGLVFAAIKKDFHRACVCILSNPLTTCILYCSC